MNVKNLPPIPNIRILNNLANDITFRPNKGGQTEFFESKKHQVIFAGGNKSGKSFCGVVKLGLRTVPEIDIQGNRTGWLLDPWNRTRVPRRKVRGWVSTYSDRAQQENIQGEIDRIIGPYIVEQKMEGGAYHRIHTEIADIFFKWQTQGANAYAGPNLDCIFMDEPHDRLIYHESVARLLHYKGYLWICMTPIIDVRDPDYATKQKYISWMEEDIVRNIDKLKDVDLIYVDIEENPHIDIEFVDGMFEIMSPEERFIRRKGRFSIIIAGQCLFDKDMLLALKQYMISHPDEFIPEYGYLEHDDTATDDFKIIFRRSESQGFPRKPGIRDGFIWKIWEHPMTEQLGYRPSYVIGCDSAEGKGGDYTSVTVERTDTKRVVATGHGYISEEDGSLARELWKIGHYYCNDRGDQDVPAMLGIECVNTGKLTLSYLIHGNPNLDVEKYGLNNLYRRPSRELLLLGKATGSDNVGWYTDRTTRTFLLGRMGEALLDGYRAIENKTQCPLSDPDIIEEAMTFILWPDGKYKAAAGNTDDRLFSKAIADEMIRQGVHKRALVTRKPKEDTTNLYHIKDGKIVLNEAAIRKMEKTHAEYL